MGNDYLLSYYKPLLEVNPVCKLHISSFLFKFLFTCMLPCYAVSREMMASVRSPRYVLYKLLLWHYIKTACSAVKKIIGVFSIQSDKIFII